MLVEDEISMQETFKLSNDRTMILEEQRSLHVKGKSKSYSREEAKSIIRGKRKL